jgi:hypothetical protein
MARLRNQPVKETVRRAGVDSDFAYGDARGNPGAELPLPELISGAGVERVERAIQATEENPVTCDPGRGVHPEILVRYTGGETPDPFTRREIESEELIAQGDRVEPGAKGR